MIIIEIFAFMTAAAFLSAQAIYWLWWFMGSPYVVDAGDITQATAADGRIFSFLGRFVAKKYSEFELQKYSEFIENAPYNNATKQYEPTMKYEPTHLNFWKIAGCCIYCMAVWVAAFFAIIWYFIAAQNLGYNAGVFLTSFIWFFYTFFTLFFIKKELE